MADSIALENSAITDKAPDMAQNVVSRGLGSLWSRVQKVRENLNSISRQDIVNRVQQTADSVRNISREDIVNHVKKTGENLRNMSREDVLFLGLSIGAGLGAKAAAVGGLALAGVATGGAGFAALGVVVAGGAAASLARKGVKHLRAVKDGSTEKFFKRENFVSKAALMGAAFGVGISALTFGASELFEHATGHSIGETLGNGLNKLFNKASHAFDVQAQVLDNVPQGMEIAPASEPIGMTVAPTTAPVAEVATPNIPQPMEVVPASEPIGMTVAPAVTPDNIPQPLEIAPATPASNVIESASPSVPEAVPDSIIPKGFTAGESPRIDNSTRERAMAWVRAHRPMAADDVPTTPVATPVTPVASAPVTQPTGSTVRERALAWVKKMHPTEKFTPEAPVSADKVVEISQLAKTDLSGTPAQHIVLRASNGLEVRMPAAPDIAAEKQLFMGVIQDQALRAQLDTDYLTQFGEAAPTTMTAEQMATRMYPDNPAAYLKSATEMSQHNLETGKDELAQNFQKLTSGKIAAACVTDLPSSQAAFDKQGGVLPNTCVMGKLDMAAGDYTLVRDIATTKPYSMGGGIRVLFAGMAERTQEFIARAVTAETLQDMTAEKLSLATPAP